MTKILKELWEDERGQGMAEYGLILALVSVVVISVLGLMGTAINDKFTQVKDAIGGGTTTP